jgi:small-conductance mechanosensitive channel
MSERLTTEVRQAMEIRPSWTAYGLFVVKLALLVGLIVLQNQFPSFLLDLGIPDRYLRALLFFLTGQLIISFARSTLATLYRRKHLEAKGRRDNFILGINQIAGIASFVVFAFAALMVFDIHIREALTAISIVAAAIAILSKDYVSNMINGMILMFSNQISLDDMVQIGEHRGKIVDLTLLHVHVLNDDDDVIYIPNNLLLTEGIINYTRRPLGKISVEFDLPLSRVESVEDVERYLQEILSPHREQIVKGSYHLKTIRLSKDSVSFKFQCLLKEKGDREVERSIKKMVLRSVVVFGHGTQSAYQS